MPAPLYLNIEPPTGPGNGHRGLWHERFFNGYDDAWALNQMAKKTWLDTLATPTAIGDRDQIVDAGARLAGLCSALNGETRVYGANWHFATGLGNPHPVENGFLWHPVLGIPYIGGAAVKGLVRAWVEAWEPFPSEQARRDTLYHWFGSEDKAARVRREWRIEGYRPPSQCPEGDTEAGAFIFFDALPVEPVRLKCDVMTPHMGKWYERGGNISDLNDPACIPADWHDPVPVFFLVADRPRFQFALAPRTEAARAELPQVLDALHNALQWLGAGAKTAVGYGVMARDEKQEAENREMWEKTQKRSAETARLASMTPEQLAIDAFRSLYEDTRQQRFFKAGGPLAQRFKTIADEALSWPADGRAELIPLLREINKSLEGDKSARRKQIVALEQG